jgi:acyl dehydratase
MAAELSAVRTGETIPTLVAGPVKPLTLALFAGGSGDHNPIHVDPVFAQSGGFDAPFAHGMLSMAYLGRALTDWAGVGAVRKFSVRFAAITPLGARVSCNGRVEEIVEQDGERLARLTLQAALEDGTVTLSGDALVRIG